MPAAGVEVTGRADKVSSEGVRSSPNGEGAGWLLLPQGLLVALVVAFPVYRSAELVCTEPAALWRVFTDRVFVLALVNTTAFTLIYATLLTGLGLGLGVLLNSDGLRIGKSAHGGGMRGLVRTLIFSPYLVGPVYLAGLVLAVLGGGGRAGGEGWLSNPFLTMPILLVASLWAGVGYAMTYVLAALQGVNSDLLSAAELDGASRWQRFTHVTLPAIGPTLSFVALTAAVGGMNLFELPFVLYGGPGPANTALTLSMVLYGYQFQQGDAARAASLGWMTAILLTGVSAWLVGGLGQGGTHDET